MDLREADLPRVAASLGTEDSSDQITELPSAKLPSTEAMGSSEAKQRTRDKAFTTATAEDTTRITADTIAATAKHTTRIAVNTAAEQRTATVAE